MDRYKKHTTKHLNSVDGFLSTGPRRSVSKDTAKSATFSVTQQRPTTLDDFRKPEGFTRQKLPQTQSSGAFNFTNSQKPSTSTVNNNNEKIESLASTPRSSERRFGGKSRKDSGRTKTKKRRGTFKTFAKLSLLLIVIGIGIFGFMFGKAWWDTQKALGGGGTALALSKDIDPNTLNGEGDGRINVLLMGKGGDAHEGGQLTDTMMIASIDPINNGIVLLSIPRDLWVKPDKLWPMKINAVYNSAREQAYYKNKDKAAAEDAGIAASEQVVEEYMDININYYAMVDFTAFQEAVDILGGITVNLPQPYSDPTMKIGKKLLDLPAGPNDLDGGTALGLARSRKGSYEGEVSRGDFQRGENQQIVLLGIKDKALSMGTFANPLKLAQLTNTFGNRVKTNFSTDDMLRLYELSKNITNDKITNVDLAMEGEAVVTTGTIGGQSVVYPVAGEDDYSKVKAFVRKKLVDSFIIKENPSIIILNGSGKPGIATKRAEELKSYGYNVIQVADASTTDIPITQLVDNTKGAKKYTKRYLELRFGTQTVKSVDGIDLSPYIADYIVVIGQNG